MDPAATGRGVVALAPNKAASLSPGNDLYPTEPPAPQPLVFIHRQSCRVEGKSSTVTTTIHSATCQRKQRSKKRYVPSRHSKRCVVSNHRPLKAVTQLWPLGCGHVSPCTCHLPRFASLTLDVHSDPALPVPTAHTPHPKSSTNAAPSP